MLSLRKNKKWILLALWTIAALGIIAVFIVANDIGRVFMVIAGALYLFTTEKFPVDLTAISIMVTLMLFGLVTPEEGVSGFSSSATLTVLAMFILSTAIQRTGIIHLLGRYIFRFAGNSEFKQLLAISIIVGPISGFINNTAAVAIMLPMILDLTKRAKTSATKLLIPLSYLSMAGGTLTLIGTSTNILANSVIRDAGLDPITMFELLKLGAIVLLVTTLFFLFIGRWLLPERRGLTTDDGEGEIESDFLGELIIENESPLIGKTLQKSQFLEKHDLQLVKLVSGQQSHRKEAHGKVLKAGDVLVFRANQKRFIDLDKDEKSGIKLLLDFDENRRRLPGESGQIMKVLVRSPAYFHKRSLAEIGFWERFGAAVVGLHREKVATKRLSDMKLEAGEILLVKASKRPRSELMRSNDFLVIETIEKQFQPQKTWLALGILTAVIAVAAFGIFPIMVSALTGVILMILTGCLEPEDLHRSVSWDVIFLLAGVIPLGIAMQKSGGADMIAEFLASGATFLPPIIILGLFYLITTLLTEIVSNNASVVLLIPVALSVADRLFLNPRAFVFAVMFAASTSFLTPVGYQTNTMVFGAGNYKFSDFLKVGAPLNALLLIITTLGIAFFWGLERGL